MGVIVAIAGAAQITSWLFALLERIEAPKKRATVRFRYRTVDTLEVW